MVVPNIETWIAFTNMFIAVFIFVYAYLFLKRTNAHKDRRPWDLLFLASFIYLLFQIINVLYVGSAARIWALDLDLIRSIFAFMYSGAILLAFISQHDLILRSQLILISKKDAVHMEKDLEVKIALPTKEEKTAAKK